MKKVLVLGIDGGSINLIKEWKDELPNFKAFLEAGAYGTLESTLPPITSPAWNCMFTGKNPAKIGLFDFYVLSFEEKDIRMVNSTYQDSPYLWEILSSFNLRVGVVNVPNTYPPREVNGFMVCGGILNHLAGDKGFTYPPELKEELNRVVDGYEIMPLADLLISGKESEYLKEFDNILNKQISAVRHLMKRYPWGFFAYVIFETDQVQHYFWHHMDKNHPKWNRQESRKYESVIKDFYKKVDGAVGELVAQWSDEANIIIVSDHGFGPLHGYFRINEWLKKKGYLKIKPRKGAYNARNMFERVSLRASNFVLRHFGSKFLKTLLKIIPQDILRRFTYRKQKKDECKRLLDAIDWSETRAFGLRMGIYINLKGRFQDGIVQPGEEYERLRDKIIESLHQIRDPTTGRRIVTRVFKKEEIYSGKHMDAAPDLVYIVDDMRYRPVEGVDDGKFFIEPKLTGDHRLQGMFMAYGPDIKKVGKEIPNIKIYDITPTVLHILGIPIPKDVDGRVLREIFDANSELARKPIVYQAMDEKAFTEHEEAFNDRDEERIKVRLRRLGYL